MKHLLPFMTLALAIGGCASQVSPSVQQTTQPPDTEIFVASVFEDENGRTRLGEPRNVTRRPGYDNQPAFTPEGDILYTRMSGDGSTDIWRISEGGVGETRQITRTTESEYSPTPLPDGSFSVVRVESDQRQRLWKFLPDGTAVLVLPDLEPVGYHAWVVGGIVAFVLGEPPTLVFADPEDATPPRVVAENPGRALVPLGANEVAFVRKSDHPRWELHAFDASSGAIRAIARMPGQIEDFTVDPGGRIWTGDDSKILRLNPSTLSWEVIADFSGRGIGNITRMAFSPDGLRLAFVSQK
ncbi:MAG TPA: hypothetical protein VM557_08160 [Thermoanaerobaculia bacterium]|nr:hypothetical protein [Thermoanaerobaculia bacterium]